mmetsp:Transcript_40227/g.130174  ORF Transcript_40227/g.130174 Transcript_40227/m.130174 type:complete len:207 (-) Transcript_40227:274-894(-)
MAVAVACCDSCGWPRRPSRPRAACSRGRRSRPPPRERRGGWPCERRRWRRRRRSRSGRRRPKRRRRTRPMRHMQCGRRSGSSVSRRVPRPPPRAPPSAPHRPSPVAREAAASAGPLRGRPEMSRYGPESRRRPTPAASTTRAPRTRARAPPPPPRARLSLQRWLASTWLRARVPPSRSGRCRPSSGTSPRTSPPPAAARPAPPSPQ